MKQINQRTLISDLIFESPTLLLILEHFEIPFQIHNKSISEICEENGISSELFIAIVQMCMGFYSYKNLTLTKKDLARIILFLKNSHRYYENEKYPEIKNYISQLTKLNNSKEIKLVGKFFDEYFSEVKEHLNYEDEIAFPYFLSLLSINIETSAERKFSVNDYNEHHSDIQCKLNDLKELLLNHIPIKKDRTVRRKIILSLYELQKHLNVHSCIEENIIVPSIAKLEKEIFDR